MMQRFIRHGYAPPRSILAVVLAVILCLGSGSTCILLQDPSPPDKPGDVEEPDPGAKALRSLELVYFSDFETDVGAEWSNIRRDATPTASRRFLGQYRNDTATLTLSNLPPHSNVSISFDVYVIGSWDGNSGDAGPDIWYLSCDGKRAFETSFAYWPYATQAYPNVYPIGNNGAQSGAIESGSLGYQYSEGGRFIEWNAVYNTEISVPHTADTVSIAFAARGLEADGSESWGLDNVTVRLSPAPDDWATALTVEAEDFAVRPSGGPITNGWLLWQTARLTDWIEVMPGGTRLRINTVVRSDPANGRWPIMGLTFNQRFLSATTIAQRNWTSHTLEVQTQPGLQQLGIAFTNDEPPTAGQDRNLYVDKVEILVPPGTPQEAWPVRRAVPDFLAEPAVPETDAEVVALADQNIERYRKSDFHVVLATPEGEALDSTRARFQMFRHAFRWGSAVRFNLANPNTPIEQAYRRDMGRLFNYATTEDLIRWGAFEAERGNPRFADLDTYLALCDQLGLELKGHNIIWGNFEDLPKWLTPEDVLNASALLENRTRTLVSHNAGRISTYDVVNEPIHALQWEFWATPAYLGNALAWAHDSDPSARLLINEYELVGVPDMCDNFFVRMHDLLEQGAPLGGIGIQLHANLGEWYTPRQLWRAFERLKTLGVSLELTEISLGQRDAIVVGGPYDGQPWTNALQSQYYEQVVRVAFGHPDIDAVTFWGFTDRKHFQPGSGMLDANLQDKPAGSRYRELLNQEWSTDLTVDTAANGTAGFRGFNGWYRVTSGDLVGTVYLTRETAGTAGAPTIVVMGRRGDGNRDGVIDQADYEAFDNCYAQSAAGPVLADCVPYDINGDREVDCTDWPMFRSRADVQLPAFPPCSLPSPIVSAPGSRYLSVTVPPGSQPVALRVTSESWLCLDKYVNAGGLLQDEPVFQLPEAWGTIDVADPFIVPGSAYTVELFTGTHFSPGADARTWMWGDTNNDGLVDGADLIRVVSAFDGEYGDIDFRTVDLAGCVPNRGVDVADVEAITSVMSGVPYYRDCPAPCDHEGNAWELAP